jgi:tetratricopeptide (TPR) repeat protein
MILLALLMVAQNATNTLEQAATAISELRIEDAIGLLERARAQGPFKHAEHVRLYEQLGIAYAYAGKQTEALSAFDRMLSLDPRAIIRYSLSPKVTLVFEQARNRAKERRPPEIELQWPREPSVADPIAIEVSVVADPDRLLRTATVYARARGSGEYQRFETNVTRESRGLILLPAMVPAATGPEVLELFAVAKDDHGNEVLEWASEKLPREIPLRFEAPAPWYRSWVFWTIAGGLAAVASGAVVIAATSRSASTYRVPVDVGP